MGEKGRIPAMKQEGRLKFLRRGTIYFKTFYGILAVSVCVLSIFYISFNLMITKQNREQIALYNLNLLRLSSESLDVAVEVMSQGMTQTMWSSDFISFMVRPNQNSQELNYRICQQLKTCVNSGETLCRAWFYSPLSDMVFESSGTIYTKQTMKDWDVIQAYEDSDHTEEISLSRTSTTLFYNRERLFLFQELNIASHIGTLVYELNMSNIRQRLLLPGKAETPILVFDEKGQSIFVNPTQRKMVPLNLNRKDLFITLENSTQQADHCLNGYYLYTGADGWCYLLPTDPSLLSISWERVLITFLPAFLLLTLVGLVLAWYISRVIYQPIDHLMRVVGANRDWDNKKQRNEVDFLESAYSLALEEQAQLHGIVSDIAPEILESMLKNLLIGKHLTQERVGEILRGINDPILVRGRFFVIACQMVPDERRKIEDTEINLYLLAIRNLVNRLSDENGKIYDIRTDVLTLGLICCYPENCSLSYLSQMSGKIQQTLQLNTQAMPFQLFCARGKIYPDLLDVRYSYREAMEKVRHQQYFRNTEGKEQPLTEGGGDGELVINQTLLQARAKDILDRAVENTPDLARSLMERVINEIDRQAQDNKEYAKLLQILQDEMLERVISYPLSQEDQHVLSQCRTDPEDPRFTQRDEMQKAFQDEAELMFRMVCTYSQKTRYKYIEHAKQYVGDNYMDSNLSLTRVGDYVGISASYLSELWREVTGEKFSVYLASLRVSKAQQLLQTTKLTTKEIGFRCGFNSVQNFIRVFKKYTGSPPGQFRGNIQ